jgi:hypothetical protein
MCMLLANLTKDDHLKSLLTLTHEAPKELASTSLTISQLLDLFVKGADGTYNKAADYDYLSYVFADLAKHEEGRKYFLTRQNYDNVIPISKLVVFTEHKSDIRRKGVASTIKNVAFEIDSHGELIGEDDINILPYLLLPIMGNEEYDEEDMLDMLPDLQLLPPDKERDSDPAIIQTHIETLMLLTTTRMGRDILRNIKVYPVVRETHLRVENDDVREVCERLVQVLMRDEEGEEKPMPEMKMLERPNGKVPKPFGRIQSGSNSGSWATQNAKDDDDDDDDKIVEV